MPTKLYKRNNYLEKIRGFYHAEDLIKVIAGVRRCGKSSLMHTIAAELLESGVEPEQIVFLDLDERKHRNVKTADQLEMLIDNATTTKKLCYLFIDEVQNVDGFEELLNGYRNDGNYSIFITGSNSYLLSGEIATKLTGRYIEFEMFPLTFEEFVDMKKFYGKTVDPDLLTELNHYINEGGFPRTIFFDKLADKKKYVRELVDEIFEKDIRRRVKIKNKDNFERVRNYVINNYGATSNIKALHRALVQAGMHISEATVEKYIQILLDARILCKCDRFDMKSKRALKGDKKYYLSDLSFYFAINTDSRINYGPTLENIVYLYSRSKGYAVSIGRIGRLECDFVLKDENNAFYYLQVCYSIMMSRETEEREYKALEQIKDNYPKYLLTTDALLQQRNGIRHQNIMRFMLSGERF